MLRTPLVAALLTAFAGAAAPASNPPPPTATTATTATTTVNAAKMRAAKKVLPLLQLDDAGVDADVRINGFDTDDLTTSRADDDGTVRGFARPMNAYSVVPAYFLKATNNTLTTSHTLREGGYDSANFACRVVVVDHDPSLDQFAAAWTTTTLGELKPAAATKKKQTRVTTFSWPSGASAQLPVWSWTRGTKIVDGPATKDGLYAAATALWTTLSALPTSTPAEQQALAATLRASTAEYAQSRALRGLEERYVDDVVTVAATLDRPGATPRAELKAQALQQAALDARKPPKIEVEVVHDGSPPIDPAMYDTPHFQLVPLPPASDLVVDTFGDGALARLRPREGNESLIAFRSNWRDGQWGRTGEIFVQFDVWFRKSATGGWEIDALVDRQMANVGYSNETLGELLEHP